VLRDEQSRNEPANPPQNAGFGAGWLDVGIVIHGHQVAFGWQLLNFRFLLSQFLLLLLPSALRRWLLASWFPHKTCLFSAFSTGLYSRFHFPAFPLSTFPMDAVTQ
jgi:hypothetical protein